MQPNLSILSFNVFDVRDLCASYGCDSKAFDDSCRARTAFRDEKRTNRKISAQVYYAKQQFKRMMAIMTTLNDIIAVYFHIETCFVAHV